MKKNHYFIAAANKTKLLGNLNHILSFWAILLFTGYCQAQVTFRLKALPKDTPEQERFYLAGSFNNWNALDPDHEFRLAEDGHHYLTVEGFRQDWIAFIITRGNWKTVEIRDDGLPKLTRKLSNVKRRSDTVDIVVRKWADLHLKVPIRHVAITIENIPKTTPPDAPLYVTGNFNGWIPGDKRYQMEPQENGSFSTKVPLYGQKLKYKYSRGNWQTIEGKAYGRPRQDRIRYFDVFEDGAALVAEDSITHWEDLSSRNFNPFTLLLVLAAIQGVILILIINSYENNNRKANIFLSAMIGLISFALVFRVAIYDREVYHFFPKMSLLPDLVYFLYAPLFFLYVRKLLNKGQGKKVQLGWHFLPVLLQMLFYSIFVFEPLHIFIERSLTPYYASSIYTVIGGLALVYNTWYWLKMKGVISQYLTNVEQTFSEDQNIFYLKRVIYLKGICLFFWFLTYLIGGIDLIGDFDLAKITVTLVDLTWVVFSLTVYLLGYFAIKQPEIFKVDKATVPEIEGVKLTNSEVVRLAEQLETAMNSDKLFLDASLTLPELSEKLNASLHEVSRAINEGFQKNFRDFINYYRVQEFIKRVEKDGAKTQTFLALAMDVGFNSKSSFNRSFKKITGKSPREYFMD